MLKYYTQMDAAWQWFRIAIIFATIVWSIFWFSSNVTFHKAYYGAFIVDFWGGVILGALLYNLMFAAFQKLMEVFLGCEGLSSMDALFLNDDDKNLSNLIACIYIEPYEYNSMKKLLLKRTEDIHRCRTKLVKKFGMYYFQQMTEEEFE